MKFLFCSLFSCSWVISFISPLEAILLVSDRLKNETFLGIGKSCVNVYKKMQIFFTQLLPAEKKRLSWTERESREWRNEKYTICRHFIMKMLFLFDSVTLTKYNTGDRTETGKLAHIERIMPYCALILRCYLRQLKKYILYLHFNLTFE